MEATIEQELVGRLVAAEHQLTEVVVRMQETQVAALFGHTYDGFQYDDLISCYRLAKREAEAACAEWQRWCEERRYVASAPAHATPHLLFAQWLYEHGRISG